ncbi:MAG: hypothetical protein ACREHD_09110, partial [Pirellulales bacterium]
MNDADHPHPNNAPGPFYVLHGCCTSCGAPIAEAPELFAYDSENHCYVRRQPGSRAVSRQIDDWLKGAGRFQQV